ncbi:MAG: zf-HC2 domain-containing protein [Chloroflexota bacterium]|nr:zf-HC2 domain-containing protein [Chloroflexota bacterium]
MTEHPELLLSAYLDEALAPSERATVDAHLAACALCRAQLTELRATSRLIGALPPLAPRRSLVPRLDRAPVWLRPVRLLGAMGSGLFVFLFIASAVINSGGSLGGGTTTAERLAEKGQFGAAANALASDAAKKLADSATAAPPVVAPGGVQPQSSDATRSTIASSPTPAPAARSDGASAFSVTPLSPVAPPTFGPPPSLFLGLAVLCAIAAFVAHRRLRRT